MEVPLDHESVAGENGTSDTDDETTNLASNSVPVGPRTTRATIGGAEVMNSEEEKDNGDNKGNPQPFSQLQTKISRSGRTTHPRQLYQNEF